MAYSVYTTRAESGATESLLSGQHSFWWGSHGPEFAKPDALIKEFLDRSVDSTIHNRTQIHRYSFESKGAVRLDPVAFQSQDFAEEWLTRPWSEMQSRSAPETNEWHVRLHDDYVSADYSRVVPCSARPGRRPIALDITNIGKKELTTPLTTYFLVHELGDYHYEMEAVSDSTPRGCRGRRYASDKHPWLSADKLKALK